jgi:hypothetical protein
VTESRLLRRYWIVRVLTIAASLCVALVAAGCASAVPAPSSTKPQAETSAVPAPSSTKPQAETFVSDRYGFSVTLPTGSVAGHAKKDWDASCLCGLDDPTWDWVSVGLRTLVVGATAVESSMDLARWRARMVELAPDVCQDSEAARRVTIGGGDALEWTASCSDGYQVIKLAALHSGRGYMVLFASPGGGGLADDQTAFDSLMSSFEYLGS